MGCLCSKKKQNQTTPNQEIDDDPENNLGEQGLNDKNEEQIEQENEQEQRNKNGKQIRNQNDKYDKGDSYFENASNIQDVTSDQATMLNLLNAQPKSVAKNRYVDYSSNDHENPEDNIDPKNKAKEPPKQAKHVTINSPTALDKKRPNAKIDSKNAKPTFFYSYKYLPVNLRTEYRDKFKGMPDIPDQISDQCKEILMTLNIARVHPKYFSNNVLEAIRDRIHPDKFYNSFSCGMMQTIEGISAIDTLLDYIVKVPPMKGLKWSPKLASLVDPKDIRRIDVYNANVFDIQIGEENYIKDKLEKSDFNYQHLYVFFEFNTSFGFEVVTNLLRDDGNEEKDVRQVLMSPLLESIAVFHERHVTGNMITQIIVASKELTKQEYDDLKRQKENANLATNADDTADATILQMDQGPNDAMSLGARQSLKQEALDQLSRIRRGSTATNNKSGGREYLRRQSVPRSLISEKLTEKLENMDKLTSYHNSVHLNIMEADEDKEDDGDYNKIRAKEEIIVIDNTLKDLESSFQLGDYIQQDKQLSEKQMKYIQSEQQSQRQVAYNLGLPPSYQQQVMITPVNKHDVSSLHYSSNQPTQYLRDETQLEHKLIEVNIIPDQQSNHVKSQHQVVEQQVIPENPGQNQLRIETNNNSLRTSYYENPPFSEINRSHYGNEQILQLQVNHQESMTSKQPSIQGNIQKYNEQVSYLNRDQQLQQRQESPPKKKKEQWELDSSKYYLTVEDKQTIENQVDEMMNYRVGFSNKKQY